MFYKPRPPFEQIQKLSFDRKHYSGVMTLTDRRIVSPLSSTDNERKQLTVVLFTENVNDNFGSIV